MGTHAISGRNTNGPTMIVHWPQTGPEGSKPCVLKSLSVYSHRALASNVNQCCLMLMLKLVWNPVSLMPDCRRLTLRVNSTDQCKPNLRHWQLTVNAWGAVWVLKMGDGAIYFWNSPRSCEKRSAPLFFSPIFGYERSKTLSPVFFLFSFSLVYITNSLITEKK